MSRRGLPDKWVEVIGQYANGDPWDSYSWGYFAAYYDPTAGMFFWFTDSGCSCNGPLDHVQASDFEHGFSNDLVKAFTDWAKYSLSNEGAAQSRRVIKEAIKEVV